MSDARAEQIAEKVSQIKYDCFTYGAKTEECFTLLDEKLTWLLEELYASRDVVDAVQASKTDTPTPQDYDKVEKYFDIRSLNETRIL